MQINDSTIVPRNISPEGGASPQEFSKEILANINPEQVGRDGEVFNPQKVALNAFENGKARLAAGRVKDPMIKEGVGNVMIESPLPGYQEIDVQVDPDNIQVSEQPRPDQASPERSPELVG